MILDAGSQTNQKILLQEYHVLQADKQQAQGNHISFFFMKKVNLDEYTF